MKRKTVDLFVTVEPGPQFTMGKLTIQGLDVETEPHIKKLWALKRGQPFNAEYPDYFLARLVEDQIMDNLGRTKSAIAPDPDNQDGRRDPHAGRRKAQAREKRNRLPVDAVPERRGYGRLLP